MHATSWIVSLLALFDIAIAKSYSKKNDAVLLSSVRSLTLHGDKQTSHRRVKAIPQLTCNGGNGRGKYEVDVMRYDAIIYTLRQRSNLLTHARRCKNSGSEYDAEDIQWTCQASLPPEFKLGSTEVVCEGYDGPDDPYILKGSCGVEYRLVLTELGEAKYRLNSKQQKVFGGRSTSDYEYDDEGISGHGALNAFWRCLFWFIFIGKSVYFLNKSCTR